MGVPSHQTLSSEPQEGLGLKIRVISGSEAVAREYARALETSLSGLIQLEVSWEREAKSEGSDSQILFLDSAHPHLDEQLNQIDLKSGPAIFLIVRENDPVPSALIDGKADDVLVFPFRPLEVLSKLRHFHKLEEYREALELNASYAKVVELLQQDLKMAERMQKLRLPRRFPEVKGFKVTSRYLAGERSGGDYVDIGDSRDGQSLAIVMTDASTYRLSSAVLDTVSRRLAHVPPEEAGSCVTAARRIRDGVLAVLGDRDHLSLFYGVLSRKDYRFRFLNLGSTRIFYAPPGLPFSEAGDGQGDPIVRSISVRADVEGELKLEPEGRLVLVSDGFVDGAGGRVELLKVLDQYRGAEAADSLNELVFRVKKTLTGPDELPVQDCTAILFDVDVRVIRLA